MESPNTLNPPMPDIKLDPVVPPEPSLMEKAVLATNLPPDPINISAGPESGIDTYGGKVASTEAQLNNKAQDTYFIDALGQSFTSGGNWAYTVYKRLEREQVSPAPDPNFDVEAYIKKNEASIPQHLQNKVRLADSEVEAGLVVADMLDELKKQDTLARRGGFSTFVAEALAGIVDLDTPLSIMSGGAASGWKGGIAGTKWGKYASGAVSGGFTQGAAQAIAYEAGTTGDWTSIPAAGLAGMAFGTFGAAFSKSGRIASEDVANGSIKKAAQEFDEFVSTGSKTAERDVRTELHTHTDVYQTVKRDDAEFMAENGPRTEGEPAKPRAFKLTDLGVRSDSVGENIPPAKEPTAPVAMRLDPVVEAPVATKDPTAPVAVRVDDADVTPEIKFESSVGARQTTPGNGLTSVTNTRSADIIRAAQARDRAEGFSAAYYLKDSAIAAMGEVGEAVGNTVRRFHDIVAASPIVSDFDRLMRSGSSVAHGLAYDLMESASGILRNNRSAAALMDNFEKQLQGSFVPSYTAAFEQWARNKGLSWLERKTNATARDDFSKEVVLELNARKYDPTSTRSISKEVKDAADAMDRWSALEIEVGRGRTGESGIKGYDALKAESGYMPQRWSSEKIEKMIREGRPEKHIVDAVAETYKAMHGNMSRKDAAKFASAAVRRARKSGQGIDTNLIGILQADGRDFLERMLQDNGMPFKETNDLIDRLTSSAAERGQAGHTKSRIDVDMRRTATNGIQMIDLFETDLVRIVSRRSRGTAGQAALARKGITDRGAQNDVIQAIIDEQVARGPTARPAGTLWDNAGNIIDADKHLTREELQDLFSYFGGGPIAGGLSPLYANIKKITNLSLLNGLGLTQLSETGASIAAVGLDRWWEHTGAALRSAANDPKSILVSELRHINIMIPEERLFRPDLHLELDLNGTAMSELAQKATLILNQGQRLQGFTSGFFAARALQQRIAATSAADKIMTNMKGLASDLSTARAADLGLDQKTWDRIKQYVDDGTVEFKDGSLYKLNFDKWDPDIVEDFALSLNRHINQVVQKAMLGESSLLFHKDGIASLFFHLKSFPILAMEKQFMRNIKMGDQDAMTTFLYGLGTAGTVYAMKQALAGKTDDATDPVKVAKGAFGMSNLTGWIPMWTDPVAGMLGINSMKFNEYNRGIDSNIMSVPATLTTMNRMLNIPGAAANMLSGNYSNNDVRALQATPIIGNAYGFTALFNAMKHTPESRRAAKQADKIEKDKELNALEQLTNDVTE